MERIYSIYCFHRYIHRLEEVQIQNHLAKTAQHRLQSDSGSAARTQARFAIIYNNWLGVVPPLTLSHSVRQFLA